MNEETRRPPDLLLLVAVLVLLVLGIVMVYSASFIIAHNEFGDNNYFLTRHLMALTIGLVAMGFLAGVDYRRWRPWALPAVLATIALLALVLVPGIGVEQYGARRWLATGGVLPQLQPSELAKLAVIVFMASWLAGNPERAARFTTGSLPFLAVVGIVAALIMKEPDMGTTVVLVLAAATVFWAAGANVLHVAFVGALGVSALAYLATSVAYRAERFQGWVDPWSDPLGVGWQTKQALTALGAGGLLGRGLGASMGKAYYLPNAHTDAIYAIVGEELGLVGTVGVLLLFSLIAWRGLAIAVRAPDRFGRLLAVGVTGLIVWQALLNMMVITNAVPFTGVTLPFLSFGGSSLVVSLAAIGLLLSVSRGVSAVAPAARPRRAVRDGAASESVPALAFAGDVDGMEDQGGGRRRPVATRRSRSKAAWETRAGSPRRVG